jgi:sucrose-6-phosphate hydrolase SacC (GH32 family)
MKSEPVTEAPAGLPAGPGTAWAENFRDPFVWEEDGVWYQLVGSGIVDYNGTQVTKKHGGTALVYTARRPEGPWTYRGPLHSNDLTKIPEPGEVWELPVLLPLPGPKGKRTGKHILLVSPWWEAFNPNAVKHTYYWIGTFDKKTYRFTPDHEKPREFDFGEHFTGPSGFVTPDGRSVLFSITQDRRSEQQHAQSGWAHNAGMPVSVSLRQDGTLGVEPIEEAAGLRGRRLVKIRQASVKEADRQLVGVSGDMLDIEAVIEPRGATTVTLAVRASADGSERTLLSYDTSKHRFSIDRGRSSLDPDVRKGVHGGTVELVGGQLKLRVLLDRSMLEAYVNGTNSLTSRVYPTRKDATGLRLTSEGGSARVVSLDVWRMNGAYDTSVAPAAYDPPRPTNVDALPNHDFATGDLTGWTVVSGPSTRPRRRTTRAATTCGASTRTRAATTPQACSAPPPSSSAETAWSTCSCPAATTSTGSTPPSSAQTTARYWPRKPGVVANSTAVSSSTCPSTSANGSTSRSSTRRPAAGATSTSTTSTCRSSAPDHLPTHVPRSRGPVVGPRPGERTDQPAQHTSTHHRRYACARVHQRHPGQGPRAACYAHCSSSWHVSA